jgi:carboxypeptidase PM20D1
MKKTMLLSAMLLMAFVLHAQTEQVDADRVQRHLSEALQIRTVSCVDETQTDWAEFERFHAFLERSYPLIHRTLHREKISKASLLYTWQGTRPDLDPIAVLAHMDVVPAVDEDGDLWQHPPFSGFNDGEYIWGRGALDMKNVLICVMEAVETLLEEGYVPERTVYLCFGHNEETAIGEENGAKAIVKTMKDRGIHFEATIDEGGAILPVDIKGVLQGNLVGIGVAEKGFANVKVTVRAAGGHASQPPKHTAAGQLAKVVRDLERHPFEPQMLTIVDDMFRTVGKNTQFPIRWLAPFLLDFQPLFFAVACQFPPGAAFVRTTMACTMLEGSPSPNVLPEEACVTVDCRMLPGTTAEDVERHIRKVVRNKDIEVEFVRCKETTAISPVDSKAYAVLTELSQQRDGKNIVAPYLVMGRTDSFHYEAICENIYRYSPFLVPTSLLLTTHAANERCPVDQLAESVRFYKLYIKRMTE